MTLPNKNRASWYGPIWMLIRIRREGRAGRLDSPGRLGYHFDVSANDDYTARSAVRELLAVMKALADPSRLRIVAALNGRELCLCQIVELVGLATSTVSRHMSILEQARLVDVRKEGRWTYFRLAGEQGGPRPPKLRRWS